MTQWEDVDDSDEPVWDSSEHDSTSQPQYGEPQHSQPQYGDPQYSGPQYRQPSDTSDSNPFGGVEQVDGLVYTEESISPELQWQQQPVVPPPPVRDRPQPQYAQRAEPWKAGPDPEPARQRNRTRNNGLRLMVATLFPLLVIAGLGWLVYRIMNIYGF